MFPNSLKQQFFFKDLHTQKHAFTLEEKYEVYQRSYVGNTGFGLIVKYRQKLFSVEFAPLTITFVLHPT